MVMKMEGEESGERDLFLLMRVYVYDTVYLCGETVLRRDRSIVVQSRSLSAQRIGSHTAN